ncbi:armadillo-type protein [Umbelopsis sp. PMI_123]|nr:armadillo-type protein [Umbelopsis sp. PMI_123]
MTDARSQLLDVLDNAASQQPEKVKLAQQQLKQWETSPDFYATLQDIFYDTSLPINLRFVAGLYLKNGIDVYWRKTAKNAIRPEERAQIRSRLLTSLNEENKQLAVANAVLISKIARFDYPQDWPDLLHNLLHVIQTTASAPDSSSQLLRARSLHTLNLVIKALCSKTLAPARRQFQQIAPDLFRSIASIYVSIADLTISKVTTQPAHLNNDEEHTRILSDLDVTATCLKCLRRLLIHGFTDLHQSQEVREFISITYKHIQQYFEMRSVLMSMNFDEHSPLRKLVESHITKLGKLYNELQKTYPVSFILLPSTIDIIQFYWQHIVHEGERAISFYGAGRAVDPPLFERFLVQGLLLLKRVIKGASYAVDAANSDEENANALQAKSIIDSRLLTPEFVNTCAEVLVTKYMQLRPEDLDLWESDPEGLVNGEEADHWEFELKPCAEKVFMDLLTSYRVQLSPILINLVDNVAVVTDHNSLLFKDAIYCSVGLGANELFDSFDFNNFLVNRLVPEASNKEPSFKILRRRIAWIIGHWIGVKIDKQYRSYVYQIMLQLLAPEEDMVVRLVAANNLRNCVDDWDFETEDFVPYIEPSIQLLTALLKDVEECDSRMRILSCLNIVIDRVESRITPYAQQIVELLPPLWAASEEDHLFKSTILVTLTKLMGSLKEQSSHLYDYVLPLIEHSVDRNQEAHIYLLEDGLDLWWVTIQSATECSPRLLQMFPIAIEYLEYGTETLRKVLKIIESYTILAPDLVLSQFALRLFTSLTNLIGDLKPEATNTIIHLLDTILFASPVHLYAEALFNSNLLWRMLNIIMENKEYAFILTQYLSIFARIAIFDLSIFLNFIEMAGQQFNPTQPGLLGAFIDNWLDKFDNISHPRQRKLACMAITNLIATTNPIILDRLHGIMVVWSDVLSEVKESGGGDALVYWDDNSNDIDTAEIEGTPETRRRKELLQRDPIHTTNLLTFIQTKLKDSEYMNGGTEAFNKTYLSKVDVALLDQMSTLLMH